MLDLFGALCLVLISIILITQGNDEYTERKFTKVITENKDSNSDGIIVYHKNWINNYHKDEYYGDDVFELAMQESGG